MFSIDSALEGTWSSRRPLLLGRSQRWSRLRDSRCTSSGLFSIGIPRPRNRYRLGDCSNYHSGLQDSPYTLLGLLSRIYREGKPRRHHIYMICRSFCHSGLRDTGCTMIGLIYFDSARAGSQSTQSRPHCYSGLQHTWCTVLGLDEVERARPRTPSIRRVRSHGLSGLRDSRCTLPVRF